MKVRLCLHIKWKEEWQHTRDPLKTGLAEFAAAFRDRHWPGERLPEIYYDPRSLKPFRRGEHRPVQHSKCIIVDDRMALVTSANFSESAHHRNIEAGVLLDDPIAARRLTGQFELLIRHQKLLLLTGLG
jgi:phosphatidylserine/phosphatidylglycerophosphate/cardiolipin synthase-like enzyme